MMLRVLFCLSCCGPPPNNRAKRRAGSSQQLRGSAKSSRQDLRERKVSQDSTNATLAINDKEHPLASQIENKNSDYGARDENTQQQGKLELPVGSEKNADNNDQMIGGGDSSTHSTSTKFKRADAIDYSDLNQTDIERLKELGAYEDDDSISSPSSIDVGPFTEPRKTSTIYANVDTQQQQQQLDGLTNQEILAYQQQVSNAAAYGELAPSQSTAQRYEPLTSTAKNVPSTTKIGDYARIEYSPIEDLDSLTTMSYSRLGSEKGGSRSQAQSAGSTLSRQNPQRATFNEESVSRRSSHGGIESTSISIASQLSNEQFQQNLTNMLESVNSNYPNMGTIGLPLGPPLEGTLTETSKTSPETPGAALTSASQDSLSDVAFDEISPMSSRPGTLRSNVSTGAALVGGESVERSNAPEEMAELAQPAPLASGEDEEGQQSYPSSSTLRLAGERVDTPQSMATTTSGGLTNPTPTPSEMSGGSGKKKRSKAKSLFKKLKPGSKKSKKDVS